MNRGEGSVLGHHKLLFLIGGKILFYCVIYAVLCASLPPFHYRSSTWRQEAAVWWPSERCCAPSSPNWSGSPLCSPVSQCLCRRILTSRWRPGLGRLLWRRRRKRNLRSQRKGGKWNDDAPGIAVIRPIWLVLYKFDFLLNVPIEHLAWSHLHTGKDNTHDMYRYSKFRTMYSLKSW